MNSWELIVLIHRNVQGGIFATLFSQGAETHDVASAGRCRYAGRTYPKYLQSVRRVINLKCRPKIKRVVLIWDLQVIGLHSGSCFGLNSVSLLPSLLAWKPLDKFIEILIFPGRYQANVRESCICSGPLSHLQSHIGGCLKH